MEVGRKNGVVCVEATVRLGQYAMRNLGANSARPLVDKFTNFMVGRNPVVIESFHTQNPKLHLRKGPHFSPPTFCSITIRFHQGNNNHPPAYLKSTALVERWRMIGGNSREEDIERRAQATSSARESWSNRRSVGADVQFHTPPRQVKRRRFSDCHGITKELLMNPELMTRIKFLPGMLTLSEMSNRS